MRTALLTVLFALSALGAALLARAITDLVPDAPPPTRSIELIVDAPMPTATPPDGGGG